MKRSDAQIIQIVREDSGSEMGSAYGEALPQGPGTIGLWLSVAESRSTSSS